MEFAKEIAEIKARTGNSYNIVNSLEEQKNEIDKKIYMVNVVSVACEIQDMINNGEFSNFNVDKLNLSYANDTDYGNILRYQLLDKNNQKIKKSLADIYQLTDSLDEKFEGVSGFELEHTSIQLKDNDSIDLSLNDTFEDKFIQLMLSKELYAILEHAELQNTLPSNEVTTKKPKM